MPDQNPLPSYGTNEQRFVFEKDEDPKRFVLVNGEYIELSKYLKATREDGVKLVINPAWVNADIEIHFNPALFQSP